MADETKSVENEQAKKLKTPSDAKKVVKKEDKVISEETVVEKKEEKVKKIQDNIDEA